MNHDDKKKYFELFALKILKEYQNVEIEKLIHDEKPDWQDINNSIGIEITRNSIGTQFCNSFSIISLFAYIGENINNLLSFISL